MTYYWYKPGTKVVIWGAGVCGKKVLSACEDYYDVQFFVDMDKDKMNCEGYPCYTPEKLTNEGYRIIIAVNNNQEIVVYCEQLGKKFGVDFITYDLAFFSEYPGYYVSEKYRGIIKELCPAEIKKKKKVLLIGNCQIGIIREYLKRNPTFSENYILINMPPIHRVSSEKYNYIDEMFEICDIFISQYIYGNGENTVFFKTELLKNRFKGKRFVIIPNLWFDLYFIQSSRENVWDKDDGVHRFGKQPYGDVIINDLTRRYQVDSVVEILKDSGFIEERIFRWLEENLRDNLLKREKECSFVMSDFVLSNYKKELLFYTLNHPTNITIKELSVRLLHYLGIMDDIFIDENSIPALDEQENLIYPITSRMFNLEFQKDYYNQVGEKSLTFEECIRKYIMDCGLDKNVVK